MKTHLFLIGLASLLLSACNTTPEGVVNEDLSSLLAAAQASASPATTPANSATVAPSPGETAAPGNSSATPPPISNEVQPETLASGNFQDAAHKVSGQAQLIKIGDKAVLRLENFQTENGPDLQVYLIKNKTGSPQNNDFENLGKLRSTQGNFNYELPDGLNPADFHSVSIWCKPFSVNFGFATLN